MAHSRYLRDMTRLLRVERQLTVDQLAKRLALPRSTIYYWVRDLPLRAARSDAGAPTTSADVAAAPEPDAVPPREQSAYEEGLCSFDDLAVQPTFRDFLCIYIVDGYKRDRKRVALANADPAVMRLANRWIWRLTDKSPSLSVYCHPDQGVGELRRFWSETVGVETDAIRAQRAAEGELTRRSHRWGPLPVHGVLTITVDDTLLRARLQAWMRRMRESWR
jgi:excisionase family DNA binding protein